MWKHVRECECTPPSNHTNSQLHPLVVLQSALFLFHAVAACIRGRVVYDMSTNLMAFSFVALECTGFADPVDAASFALEVIAGWWELSSESLPLLMLHIVACVTPHRLI